MSDKLTDSEIIKALEEWIKELKDDYKRLQLLDAPMDCFEESHADTITKLSNTLDLINRQKAENERLKEILNTDFIIPLESDDTSSLVIVKIDSIKAEAYKEFVEKVKIFVVPQKANGYTREILLKRDIDNLLKELVGE